MSASDPCLPELNPAELNSFKLNLPGSNPPESNSPELNVYSNLPQGQYSQISTEQIDSEVSLLGTVTAVQANFYQVQLELPVGSDHNSSITTLLCTRRTRLKKIGQNVMVGDRVGVEEPDWAGGRGAIAQVFPRRTELTRPPIANANQILLVFAVTEPDLDPYILSRFLVKAESTQLRVRLCLNKCDLVTAQTLEQWQHRLMAWGYDPVFLSVQQQQEYQPGSIQAESREPVTLLHHLQERITMISGPSGVGKSSLINWLIPQMNLRVGAVSGKLGRGRHTTRHVELFELPTGGLLADSPGFNQALLDCDPQTLVQCFPEAKQQLAQNTCQFSNCLHRDEPNCGVRGDWERYGHYLDFLAEVTAYQETLHQQPDAESSLKTKMRPGGKQHSEPKLATKKYRRSSRRFQHQTLQTTYDGMTHEEIAASEEMT